jgi:hypothetical protein
MNRPTPTTVPTLTDDERDELIRLADLGQPVLIGDRFVQGATNVRRVLGDFRLQQQATREAAERWAAEQAEQAAEAGKLPDLAAAAATAATAAAEAFDALVEALADDPTIAAFIRYRDADLAAQRHRQTVALVRAASLGQHSVGGPGIRPATLLDALAGALDRHPPAGDP